MTGPLPVGADVVVTILGRIEYADDKLVSVVTRFGATLTAPLTAGVVVTVVPSQQGPPTDAQLDRLWEMVREDHPGTVSTGLMDQGPAGEPDGRTGEGGIVATTRALPAGPDPVRAQSCAHAFTRSAAPPAEVEWTGADEGDWLQRMDDYGIDTAGRTFGCPPESTCPGHNVPEYCDGSCVGRGPEAF